MRWGLTEQQFRRWEPVLKEVVERFPLSTTFKAIDMTPATAVGRFRDAVLSLRRFNWSTNVDTEKLRRIYQLMRVKQTDGGFIVLPKYNPFTGYTPSEGMIMEHTTEYLVLDFRGLKMPPEVFEALKVLKKNDLIREIHIKNLHPEQFEVFRDVGQALSEGESKPVVSVNPEKQMYSLI
jgi:hypothetical protein